MAWREQRGISLPQDVVRTTLSQCTTCQQLKTKPVPQRVMGRIHRGKTRTNLANGLYLSFAIFKGCQYMCTSVDTYSGFLVACAYANANQTNTITTLNILILYYGVPIQIQMDSGSHFKGKAVQTFADQHGV